jgi:predicted nucleic acid-binding protein
MKRIAEQDMILADTGPFCRLAEAGEAHLDAAARYLEANVRVVIDVDKELQRRSTVAVHARLTRLKLLGVPREEPITITDNKLLDRIEAILQGRRRHKPGHEREDRGEVTTALVAADLGAPVLMDDGFGKRLAAQEGVEVFTTQDLAVELAACGVLGSLHAYGIYRIVYRDSTREEFDRLVDAARP